MGMEPYQLINYLIK